MQSTRFEASPPPLARVLGLSEEAFGRLVYGGIAGEVDHYAHFIVPKRSGGLRHISVPKPLLRTAQRWILRNILQDAPVHDAAMAFRTGRSVIDNARVHAGRGLVVRVDLIDFFSSVQFHRIREVFRQLDTCGHTPLELALLTTSGRGSVARWGLPQGACTSPALSNIACHALDVHLTKLAFSRQFQYTRYADDLVFSHVDAHADVEGIISDIRRIAKDDGFVVNEKKTRVMRKAQRQVVTGLVVNNPVPRISRTDARRFRAFLHQCETRGLDVMSDEIGRDALTYANGYIAFVKMVNPEQADRFCCTHPWLAQVIAPKKDLSGY